MGPWHLSTFGGISYCDEESFQCMIQASVVVWSAILWKWWFICCFLFPHKHDQCWRAYLGSINSARIYLVLDWFIFVFAFGILMKFNVYIYILKNYIMYKAKNIISPFTFSFNCPPLSLSLHFVSFLLTLSLSCLFFTSSPSSHSHTGNSPFLLFFSFFLLFSYLLFSLSYWWP